MITFLMIYTGIGLLLSLFGLYLMHNETKVRKHFDKHQSDSVTRGQVNHFYNSIAKDKDTTGFVIFMILFVAFGWLPLIILTKWGK